MRRRVLVAVVVLASILVGALAAGTPVAGNGSVAAVTAGIELGTAPAARAMTSAAVQQLGGLRSLIIILQVALALVAAVVVGRSPGSRRPFGPGDLLLARVQTRRGPPSRR